MATTGKVSAEQMQEFYDISRQAGLPRLGWAAGTTVSPR